MTAQASTDHRPSPYISIEDEGVLFKDLYEVAAVKKPMNPGGLISGKVVALVRDMVVIDVGLKSEGRVSVEEFRNMDGEVAVAVGDEVEVVLDAFENEKGEICLSKERANSLKTWDAIEKLYDSGGIIEGVITSKVKGGMWVNVNGIRAFLPGSQADIKPVKTLDRLLGKKYQFKILKLNKGKGNIVLSRRVLLEEEREVRRKFLLENMREGQIVEGAVKNITDYGAFVDLGGIDGLLHITDMTWGRVSHPSEVFHVGDEIQVVVLKYDPENGKVSLGYKQLQPDPWEKVKESFHPGELVTGKVVNVADYGVFVELMSGVEGLIHISEMSWSKKPKHPSKIVNAGDEVRVMVLDVDPANRRISLGLKQVEGNPWDRLVEKYPVGTKVKGAVRNITDFGVFLGLDGEDIDGLIHVSDISWTKIDHPSSLFKKGDEVEVVVLQVDKENERFSLGLKQLSDDPWLAIKEQYPLGKVVEGKIQEVSEKHVSVHVEGEDRFAFVLPVSEVKRDGQTMESIFKVGEEIEVVVHHYDSAEGKIIVSQRKLEQARQKEAMKRLSNEGDVRVRFEDLLKDEKAK